LSEYEKLLTKLQKQALEFADKSLSALERGNKQKSRDYQRRFIITLAKIETIEAQKHAEDFLSDSTRHSPVFKMIEAINRILDALNHAIL
jgi:hypothetical protein